MASARRIGLVAVVASVLAAGACGSDDGDGESSASDKGREGAETAADGEAGPDAGCDPAKPAGELAAGESDGEHGNAHTFSFENEDRTYLLALPGDYDGRAAHALVFNFHGFSGNKEAQEIYTAMGDLGTERGYVVVTPEALGDPTDWNYFGDEDRPDDFGFIGALLSHLSEQLCIDEDRIYAAGHSAGSAFTGFLVCTEPYRFAAAAMVAAFIPTTCPTDEVAPSAIVFHGTDDPLVPYDGGEVGEGGPGIPPALDTLEQFAEEYSCDEPVVEQPDESIETRTLQGCVHGSEVVMYSFTGGGHGWPGNETDVDLGGQPDNPLIEFPATETILDFFDDHPRPD